jgi:hypothetical protein
MGIRGKFPIGNPDSPGRSVPSGYISGLAGRFQSGCLVRFFGYMQVRLYQCQ